MQEAARAARKRRAGALIEGSFLGDEEGGEGADRRDGGEGGQEADELAAAERQYAAELAKELKVRSVGLHRNPGGGGELPALGSEWFFCGFFCAGLARYSWCPRCCVLGMAEQRLQL